MIIEGLFYTKQHEWVKIENDTATIGVTDYAQQMSGEIVFVELPPVDKQFNVHDELAVVESSKSASDVYSPVTGKTIELNSQLQSNPELINDDCYGTGWLCKLSITGSKDTEELMNAKQYGEYLKSIE